MYESYYENYENYDTSYEDGYYEDGYNENYHRPPPRGRPMPPPPGINRPPPPQRSYQGQAPRTRAPNFQRNYTQNGTSPNTRFPAKSVTNSHPVQGLKRKFSDPAPPISPAKSPKQMNGIHSKFNHNNNSLLKNNNLPKGLPNNFALKEKKMNFVLKKSLVIAKKVEMEVAPPEFNHVNSDNGDLDSEIPPELMQPLYCKVCSVTLNAPSQAQQHYTGKTHSKKVRQYLDKVKRGEMTMDGTLILEEERSTTPELPPMIPPPPPPPPAPVPAVKPPAVKPLTAKLPAPKPPAAKPPAAKPTESVKLEVSPPVVQVNGTVAVTSTSSPLAPSAAEPGDDVYCKVCDVSFNSSKQAQQHYQGKNHARRVKIAEYNSEAVKVEPASGGKKATYMCTVCQVYATSQEQLNSHLRGAKHAARLNLKEKGNFKAAFVRPLKGRWIGNKVNGNGGLKAFIPGGTLNIRNTKPNPITANPNINHNNNIIDTESSLQPPVAKKIRRDFTNYRTPSGQFYCSSCNISANSDTQFQQHIESRKHRISHAAAKKTTFIVQEEES